ncbi:MAG: HupE/UreJ family protein [Planctomycetes bacterium]|nr:HupE/UreJ family protein [Planctomycetota bacterium]
MSFSLPWRYLLILLVLVAAAPVAKAHGVDDLTRRFLDQLTGPAIVPFLYLGAKHMVTGYDHLLFLVGVIFFLHSTKEVLIYVSCFTIGHSVTLMSGVLAGIDVDAYLIDAIIGFSIVYKGFDNLGGLKRVLGFQPAAKAAVLVFGLFHGFGLATKLQGFALPQHGLVANLVAFNVGVELGQFAALTFVLLAIVYWRRHPSFLRHAWTANVLLMSGGLLLVGYQLSGYYVSMA